MDDPWGDTPMLTALLVIRSRLSHEMPQHRVKYRDGTQPSGNLVW
jgi:hypothetical protein